MWRTFVPLLGAAVDLDGMVSGRIVRVAGREQGQTLDTEDFLAKYPILWHLTDADSWASIEEHGLQSTEQISRRRWEVAEADGEAMLSRKRLLPVVLDHPEHGRSVVRDQHPLSEERLAPALTDGMTVEGWLRMLNSFGAFFPSRASVRTLYSAYDEHAAVVIQVKTRSLVLSTMPASECGHQHRQHQPQGHTSRG